MRYPRNSCVIRVELRIYNINDNIKTSDCIKTAFRILSRNSLSSHFVIWLKPFETSVILDWEYLCLYTVYTIFVTAYHLISHATQF